MRNFFVIVDIRRSNSLTFHFPSPKLRTERFWSGVSPNNSWSVTLTRYFALFLASAVVAGSSFGRFWIPRKGNVFETPYFVPWAVKPCGGCTCFWDGRPFLVAMKTDCFSCLLVPFLWLWFVRKRTGGNSNDFRLYDLHFSKMWSRTVYVIERQRIRWDWIGALFHTQPCYMSGANEHSFRLLWGLITAIQFVALLVIRSTKCSILSATGVIYRFQIFVMYWSTPKQLQCRKRVSDGGPGSFWLELDDSIIELWLS